MKSTPAPARLHASACAPGPLSVPTRTASAVSSEQSWCSPQTLSTTTGPVGNAWVRHPHRAASRVARASNPKTASTRANRLLLRRTGTTVRSEMKVERPSGYSSTLKLNIMPLSWCSAMWQCAIHSPGLVTSSRISTVVRDPADRPLPARAVPLRCRRGTLERARGGPRVPARHRPLPTLLAEPVGLSSTRAAEDLGPVLSARRPRRNPQAGDAPPYFFPRHSDTHGDTSEFDTGRLS